MTHRGTGGDLRQGDGRARGRPPAGRLSARGPMGVAAPRRVRRADRCGQGGSGSDRPRRPTAVENGQPAAGARAMTARSGGVRRAS